MSVPVRLRYPNKLSYEARKELSKVIKKAEKVVVAEAEPVSRSLRMALPVIEAKLATPEGASDASLYGEYSALKKNFPMRWIYGPNGQWSWKS